MNNYHPLILIGPHGVASLRHTKDLTMFVYDNNDDDDDNDDGDFKRRFMLW